MKITVVVCALIANSIAAYADERLEGRIELMKLAYACEGSGEIKYETARNAALRAEQMSSTTLQNMRVSDIDRGLRDGSIAVNINKYECRSRLKQMMFELKASGAL